MFTVEERVRVRNRIVQMSRADPRLVAGALVGSTAGSGGDIWSDLDLTFGLADGAAIDEVLADWTTRLANEFHAVPLFDLPHLSTIYRVFLLPNNLRWTCRSPRETSFLVRVSSTTYSSGMLSKGIRPN